jgi:hypothetical protein
VPLQRRAQMRMRMYPQGYPLVDAAMRELWATGWQQQSVRMAAANFLTEACGKWPLLSL